MTTGRIEYAPDYKSKSKRLPSFAEPVLSGPCVYGCSECGALINTVFPDSGFVADAPEVKAHAAIHAEHARLKAAIIEAAKALIEHLDCYCFEAQFDISSAKAGCSLLTATNALLAFESEHKIGSQS